MNKRVWLNFPETFDSTTLVNDLKKQGIDTIIKRVDANDPNSILGMANQVDAVISSGERWDYDTLAALQNKKTLIIRYGAGIDNIDIAAATKLGIPIANCGGANASSVAELALIHMLNCLRRLSYSVSGPPNGIWPQSFLGNEIGGKTVGLIGFGNIAKNLRRMLSGFECSVLVYDAFCPPDEKLYNVSVAESIEQIFRECDIISLHLPLNEDTFQLINMDYFSIMKPTAYLVNTSRGAIINEKDLYIALQEGKLAGAGLDVMSVEPPPADAPLLHMPNVFVSTHMGASTYESEQRSQHVLAISIIDYLAGKVPNNILNKSVLVL